MLGIKYQDWCNQASANVNQAIKSCIYRDAQGYWNENMITGEILSSLIKIGTDINWKDKPLKTVWQGLKLSGTPETKYGDIAVIVRIWVNKEKYIDGVVFYEAKKQYFQNGAAAGFKSILKGQLNKFILNTSACHAVLYDFIETENGEQAIAATMQTPILNLLESIAKTAKTSRQVYDHSRLWIAALGENLIGRGLDFNNVTVQTMIDFFASKASPNFVISAAISFVEDFEPELIPNSIFGEKYKDFKHPDQPSPRRLYTKSDDLDLS
ncbi:hypothetical protein SB725_20575 [Pseudomonas sp. SIMBA_041]|uniref:hypothetical protein n=1 Tax=Pseudomonas sp. SIMBA_041 TaxID=3085782 RepID=UPI00397BBE6E